MKKLLFIFALLVTFTSMAYGQSVTISGTVTDSKGVPIIGAGVILKENSAIGAVTDIDGKYTIKVPKRGKTLNFVSIGYEKQSIPIGNRRVINVTLKDNATMLNDAVVVGYGKQAKISITGAISSVKTEDIKRSPTANISNSLSGILPGVITMQSSGQPGRDNSTIYLRGQGSMNDNSPLILVDGIERDINNLDPNEIASISVLKDASATAVFGVRGANGVILVTTKVGNSEKPELNVTAEYGYQKFINDYYTMDSWDFATLYNQALENDGLTKQYSDRQINLMKSQTSPLYPNTDWFAMMFNSYAPQQRYNVNLSGGNKKVNYFVNAGFLNQGSMLKTLSKDELGYDASSDYKRYNFRANFNLKANKRLQVGLKLAGYIGRMNQPYKSANDLYSMFRSIYQMSPLTPGPILGDYFSDPDNGTFPDTITQDGSPYGELNYKGYTTYNTANLNTTLDATLDLGMLTKGLSVKGMISYDTTNKNTVSGTTDYNSASINIDEVLNEETNEMEDYFDALPNEAYIFHGISQEQSSTANNFHINTQVSLNYNNTFKDKHHVTGLLLAQRDNTNSFNDLDYNRIGFAGRVTYRYKDTYMAEVNAGYNGSEQFAKGKRFGFFPAVSAGWVISNENFMKQYTWLSDLKLRASFGKVGSDKLGSSRFLYLDNLQVSSGGMSSALGNGKYIKEVLLGNPDLTWETAVKQNYGIDMGFFHGNLTMNVDYFLQDRTNILISRNSTPTYIGYTKSLLPKANAGNHGVEINVKYKTRFSKDLLMSFRTTFAYSKNKIIYNDEVIRGDAYVPGEVGGYLYPYRSQGFEKGQNYGYRIDWNSTGKGYYISQEEIDNGPTYSGTQPRIGDFVYKDLNGDGEINDMDKDQIGYPSVPRISYSFMFNIQYKGFDLYAMFLGIGQSYKNFNSFGVMPNNAGSPTYFDIHKEAFTLEKYNNGEHIGFPALSTNKSCTSYTQNDYFIRSRAFFRLKNVEIGYTVPKKWSEKVRISKLRIYANANNLLTWDSVPFDLIDPERGSSADYPLNRVINFGVNITF